MKSTHSFGAPVSERDAAWFEEVAGATARGAAALLAREPGAAARDTAVSLIAATDAGAPADAVVRRLLATNPQPDIGATALVLTALARSGNAARQRSFDTVHRAINFLLATQSRDGGWPAFDRGATPEPSCPAATAGVLDALGHFGFRTGQPPVDEAVAFLLARQEASGEWRNREGADIVRTTWQVIAGLHAVDFDVFALPPRRAVRWLKESQNADAGWGDSTSTETAWAVLALLAAGEGKSAEVRAGAEFLVGTQRASGAWGAGAVADTGFPLMALGRYLNEWTAPAETRNTLTRIDAGRRASGPKSYRHTLAEM